MRVSNRMFAYYDQAFDLILPITNRYLRQLWFWSIPYILHN